MFAYDASADPRDGVEVFRYMDRLAPSHVLEEFATFAFDLYTLTDRGFADCDRGFVRAFMEPALGLDAHDRRRAMLALLSQIVPNPAFVEPIRPGSVARRQRARYLFRRRYWRTVAARCAEGATSSLSARLVRRSAAFHRAAADAGWVSDYDPGYYEAVGERLARVMTRVPSPRVLDLGAGTGRVRDAVLRSIPAARVVGLDLFRSSGVVVADALRMPVRSAAVDAVVATLLELVADPAALVAEMARVLRPGGVCVTVTPSSCAVFLDRNPLSYFEGLLATVVPAVLPPRHHMLQPLTPLPLRHWSFTEGELRRLFAAGFEPVAIEAIHFDHLRRLGLERLAPRLPWLRRFGGLLLAVATRA
ncbi:MAG: class I SAM-dependent methyltransferase [Gemmatimonadales bacterium]